MHYVFYLPKEHMYTELSSASRLLPKDKDLMLINPLEQIMLTDATGSFPGIFVAKSLNQGEIQIIRRRLQRKIDSGEQIDAKTSMSFLNDTFSEKDDTTEAEQQLPSPECSYVVTAEEQSVDQSNAKCLQLILQEVKKTNNLLSDIKKEQVKTRKYLSRRFPTGGTSNGATGDREIVESHVIEPVLFNDRDLTRVGSKNMSITSYALFISRILWKDEELKNARLNPKRRKGRRSLSPTRSALFKRAVSSRFGLIDDEDIEAAFTAVNQLGIDLSRGKRSRPEEL